MWHLVNGFYMMIKLNYTDQKKLLPNCQKIKLKKQKETFLGSVYLVIVIYLIV